MTSTVQHNEARKSLTLKPLPKQNKINKWSLTKWVCIIVSVVALFGCGGFTFWYFVIREKANDEKNGQPMEESKTKEQQALPEEEWNTEVQAVDQFGIVAAPNLGEYAGGDGLKLSPPLLVMKLPSNNIPKNILSQLPDHINECIERNKDQRVARLPETHIDKDEFMNEWTKTCHFELQSHVPMASTNRYNLMYQGWLFKDIVNEPNRLGCSLWPLVGIYDCFGCEAFDEENQLDQNDEALRYAGFDALNWSDQHYHAVDDLDGNPIPNQRHIGSDMAKIIISDLNAPIVKFWSVCVDVDHKKVDISLIYLIGHANESNVEGVIRNCDPQKSKKSCMDFYRDFVKEFGEFFGNVDAKSELKKFLFGDSGLPQPEQ